MYNREGTEVEQMKSETERDTQRYQLESLRDKTGIRDIIIVWEYYSSFEVDQGLPVLLYKISENIDEQVIGEREHRTQVFHFFLMKSLNLV